MGRIFAWCLFNGRFHKQLAHWLLLSISTGFFVVLAHVEFSATAEPIPILDPIATNRLQPHPLPPTLAQWQDVNKNGDYFSQVTPTEVGYLVWSQFPVRVYIERASKDRGAEAAQRWVKAVLQAVQEWNVYIPLEVVDRQDKADINILGLAPPLRTSLTGKISRARSAETRYELYISNTSNPGILSHRCTILLRPSQTSQYLQAAARHELGHAMGIWGHSSMATDALYFSQVRNPPLISPRDINTLKRVYEQPTRLGWSAKSSPAHLLSTPYSCPS